MKLVNIVQRQRYKKDLESFIKKLAPELLSSQNYKAAIEKLVNVGLVSPGEQAYFNIRLQAKMIILMIEQLLDNHGIDAIGSIAFVDKEHTTPGTLGKIVHLSGPHMPEEYINAIDGKDFTPCFGMCGKAYAANQVVECYDVENEPAFKNFDFMQVYRKYHFRTVVSFPIHIDGEVIGTLSIFSTQCLEPSDVKEVREVVRNKLYDLENVFAAIQEDWKNRNTLNWKSIIYDKMIYYVEEKVGEVLGYEPLEMMHRPYKDFTHEEDTCMLREKLAYLHEHLTSFRTVLRCKKKDGAYVVVEALFIPITTHDKLRYIEVFISTNTKACHEFEAKLCNMNRKKYRFN